MIRNQVARAIKEHSRSVGKVPGGWERFADEILNPQVDWRRELDSYTSRQTAMLAGKKDYTYGRMSRRSLPGIVMPAMRKPPPPQITLITDTSASMSDRMVSQMKAEITALLKRLHGAHVTIIACDAGAAEPQMIRKADDIRFIGGGGTDMRVGIELAAGMRPKQNVIIVITDGGTAWPVHPPKSNPYAKYVVVLTDASERDRIPAWMHVIEAIEQD